MSEISIGDISSKPGTKTRGLLKISTRSDGTKMGIPILIANGNEKGPILLVDGSCHGDEAEGGMAILKTFPNLNPKKMKGTVICVPNVNIPAFEAKSRGNPFDRWYPDLNRTWPGKSDGSISEMIAYTYFNEVASKADYVWSMHGGGNILYMGERINVNPSLPKSLELAKGLGPGWDLFAIRLEVLSSNLGSACADKGIASITTELGGVGDRMPGRWERNVQSTRGALENVLKHLGITEGTAEYPQNWRVVEYSIPRLKYGGIMDPQTKCRIGESVEKGDVLIRVINLFGDEVEVIEAPHEGIVLGVPVCPNAYPGDMAVVVGKITRIIEK